MIAETTVSQVASPQLDITLVRDPTGRTYIGGQYVAYPFHLCRALRTSGDPAGMPTLYIQSCSGGLFEGEDLHCRFHLGRSASAHITTAASTIVHSMEAGRAALRVDLEVEAGGFLEYLPDPLILFPGARLRSVLNVSLAPQATVLLWDSMLAHDPKAGAGVFHHYESELNIRGDQGRLLARDRYRVEGTSFARDLPGVMGRHRMQAGFALVGAGASDWIGALRAVLASHELAYGGVSTLPNAAGLWVRVLAPDAAIMREVLTSLWSRARQLITGVPPAARRK